MPFNSPAFIATAMSTLNGSDSLLVVGAYARTFSLCCSSLTCTPIIAGVAGVGSASGTPSPIPPALLQSAILASMASFGLSGTNSVQFASAIASGFSSGFSTVSFLSPVCAAVNGSGVGVPIVPPMAPPAELVGADSFRLFQAIQLAVQTVVSSTTINFVSIGVPAIPTAPLIAPTVSFSL